MSSPTHERCLFTFRTSLFLSTPLVSPIYAWGAQTSLFPWRGLALGLVLFLLAIAILMRVNTTEVLALALPFVLLAAPMALEVYHRRDVLTETAVVRQRGILGTRRQVIPLKEILSVEYSSPRWGKACGIGDIHIRTTGRGATLFAISNPAAAAQLILDAKARIPHGSPADV